MALPLVRPAAVDFSGIGNLPAQYMQAQSQAEQLRALAEGRQLQQEQRAALGAFDPSGNLTEQVTNLARVGAVQPGQALNVLQQERDRELAAQREQNFRRFVEAGVSSGRIAPEVAETLAMLPVDEAMTFLREQQFGGPSAVQEYRFAQEQGYQGSFNDFRNEKARSGASSVNVNAFDIPSGYQLGADGRSVTPIPGGPADPTNPKNITEGQRAASLYANRAQQAEDELGALGDFVPNEAERGLSQVPAVGNRLVSEEFQRFDQAQRNFINAILRRESGAVIADSEFANANRQYFPQPGDTASVIAQKKRNRELAIDELKRAAGGAIDTRTDPVSPTGNDPLGLR